MAPGPNGSPSLKRNIAFGRWIRHFVKKTKNGDFMKSGTVSDECFLTAFLSCWLSGFFFFRVLLGVKMFAQKFL